MNDGALATTWVPGSIYKLGECQLIHALTIASLSARCRCPDFARQASELSHPDLTGGACGHVASHRVSRGGRIRQGKEQ
jgi:hypothetical protein